MKVYELQHICNGEVKALGFFTSVKKRDEAIEKYRKLEGFSDYPLGFATFEHNLYDGKAVYQVQVYMFNEEIGFEYARSIGLFAREADAEKAAQSFIDRNRDNLGDDELKIELSLDTYKLDDMQFKEGFKTGE
ncbi:MAG: hypothetical protein Q4A83_05105 [Bacillota bacterium]|nr:hypothetical protein [Bacillota bacterium]